MGEIGDYLGALPEPQRSTLERVVALALEVAPDAVEGRSYGVPALKLAGRPLVGVVAAKEHLSIFPFSPEVIEQVSERLPGWSFSKGTIRFSADHPLPDDLVRDVVRLRAAEVVAPAAE